MKYGLAHISEKSVKNHGYITANQMILSYFSILKNFQNTSKKSKKSRNQNSQYDNLLFANIEMEQKNIYRFMRFLETENHDTITTGIFVKLIYAIQLKKN